MTAQAVFLFGGDSMGEEFIANLLSSIGIPAALCFYTLFGVNRTLKELTDAINKLTTDVDRRLDRQEDETRRLQSIVADLNHTVNALQHRRE